MSMQVGMVQVQGKMLMVLEAPVILHGQAAVHPAVLGDQLLVYLNQMVLAFNTPYPSGRTRSGNLAGDPGAGAAAHAAGYTHADFN